MAYLQLRSPAFEDEGRMPVRFTLDGGNVSPPLDWSGVPEETVELVLLCEDLDGDGTPLLHWLVTGIDPASTGVAEGGVPPGGREWPNGFDKVGWGGPHPPSGDEPHRYCFRLYALREPSSLPDELKVDAIRDKLVAEALACAVLTGLFSA
jgi:Raf kinase inhibitor-like YbhB/YbcL family protein